MELVDFREIGSGKQSTVYLAFDQELGRDVAVKIIGNWPPGRTVDDELLALQRLSAKLSQRSQTALIFATETTDDGGAFLVMEYAEGGTGASLLAHDGPIAPEKVVTIGLAASQALATAHADGILHEAISPENLLIDIDGNVKVADFGIAAALSRNSVAKEAHNEHVAPEVVRGGAPTEAADVYALGSTLYTLLEGRSPLRNSRRELAKTIDKRKRAGDAPKPLTHGSNTLQALVMGALDADPMRRPTAIKLTRELAAQPMSQLFPPTSGPPPVELGPIVVIPFFAERAEAASALAATREREPLEAMYSRNVAIITQRRLQRERRRNTLVTAGVGTAAAMLLAVVLITRGGDDNPAAAVTLASEAATSSTIIGQTPPAVASPTSILVASEAVVPASTSTTSTTSTSVARVTGAPTTTVLFSFTPATVPFSAGTTTTTTGTNRLFNPGNVVTPTTVLGAAPTPVTAAPVVTAGPAAPPPATATVVTAAPTVPAPPATPPPATSAPVINPPAAAPVVGSLAVHLLAGGNASFLAPSGDRCADSRWQIVGPVSFAQSGGWVAAPAGCWSAAHQFDTTWGSYPALVTGHYTVTLTLRKNNLVSSNSAGFDVP